MVSLRFVLLAAVMVGIALAAPAEEKSDKTEASEKKTSSAAEEKGVAAVDQQLSAFFGENTWNILSGALATALLVGGLGLGYFYFFHYYYFGSDLTGTAYNQQQAQAYPYSTAVGAAQPAYQQQYYASARSLDSGNSWNWPQVLFMISLAQESYEKFDFQTFDCQKKALCELSQKQNDFGETGRKLSSSFSFLDAVDGLPMPTIILTYLKEYKEAINQGKDSSKDCATVYPKCNFSLKEVFTKYQKRASGSAEKA